MTVQLPRIAILGAGSMGGAILAGLVAPGVTADGVTVTNRTAAKADALGLPGVVSLATERDPAANARALAGARIVLIAVKPGMVSDLLDAIRDDLEPGALVISVAVGVTAATMEARMRNTVVRAMPNTPSTVGRGVTGISAGTRAGAADVELASLLFGTVGDVVVVPESRLDALSAISGSGPAYVFLLIAELERTAQRLGFSAEQAEVMVRGTFRGASELLAASGADPAELRRRVTSPKGTTERAVAVLEEARLSEVFDRAAAAAIARARELADG
ncbi:MAG: pyrroline-5-carboxylate reductase [Micrococcales bacterium]|nr:pyrroline-5-carboxylate reductase [Micrococcales bacterium]